MGATVPAEVDGDVDDLLRFLDAAPSPFHAVAEVVARLGAAGFVVLDEADDWATLAPGRYLVVRGASVVAWSLASPEAVAGGFRIVGAHTDSPNLRVKPRPDTGRAGYRQVGVEVYGGALWNSWLDRDLGLSGRVALRPAGGGADDEARRGAGGGRTEPELALVRIDRPLLRVPQLAIHLDRGVNENGLKLNPQLHLVPLWGLGPVVEGAFAALLAEELGRPADDLLAWEVMLHDVTPAARLGEHGELVSSGRLDNLLSCWAAASALAGLAGSAASHGGSSDAPTAGVPVVCLFDHEEIGSESSTGAAGTVLPAVLERIAVATGHDRAGYLRALAASRCVSADGAHATHPNYPERHEPEHQVRLNAGPVLKHNSNVRYATDAASSGWFALTCGRAGVPTQEFVVRTDLACGSTIGPITAARLGIPTIDVGVAQLSMHSARELCGADDPHLFRRALAEFLARG